MAATILWVTVASKRDDHPENEQNSVLPLSVGDNSFSPHRLTILLDPAYSTF